MALAVVISAHAQRQGQKCSSQSSSPTSNSRVIWQGTQGDYKVTQYLVMESNAEDNEFSVRYKINLTKLISSYDKNGQELQGLDSFIQGFMKDSLKQISRIEIAGYASPDGPQSLNEKLALKRAEDFKSYLAKEYNMSKYPCDLKSEALGWDATKGSLMNSSLSNKEKAIEIIDSGASDATIENRLKGMPSVWSYMLSNTLPPMRCVELNIYYSSWKVVETRDLIKPCTPRPQMANTQYIIVLFDNSNDCVLLDRSNTPLDFNDEKMHIKFKDRHHRAKLKERMRGERFKERERRRRNRARYRERFKL